MNGTLRDILTIVEKQFAQAEAMNLTGEVRVVFHCRKGTPVKCESGWQEGEIKYSGSKRQGVSDVRSSLLQLINQIKALKADGNGTVLMFFDNGICRARRAGITSMSPIGGKN